MKTIKPVKISMSDRGLKPVADLAQHRPHGDRIKYMAGCRCVPCRAANSRYETERAAARKRGEGNPLVDAGQARRHLLKLQRAGVGRRTIADISGVCETQILKIRSGKRLKIRRTTEERLLHVTTAAITDAKIVPAGPTWAKIRRLIEKEGFTEKQIAERLGYKRPYLQIRTDRITAKTAAKIERLYNQVMQ